jgi:hypothetical protein
MASQENLPEGSKSDLEDWFVVYSYFPPANNSNGVERWLKETTLNEEFEGNRPALQGALAGIVPRISIRVAEAMRISASATEPEVETTDQ